MDKILYNGNFKTMDNESEQVSAVAIKNGIIIKMGRDENILPLANEKTELINLNQKLVLPGFHDTHLHLLFYGTLKRKINLSEVTTFEEVVKLCSKRIEQAKLENKWIIGCNFNQDNWTDCKKLPDRHDLDAICEDVPIALLRACGHIACLNTKGLRVLKLWDERKENTEKILDFGTDGKPNGYVREKTAIEIQPKLENFSIEDMKNILVDACNEAASKGITQLQSDDFNILNENDYEDVIKVYKELCEEDKLPIRVVEQARFASDEQLEEFLKHGHRFNESYGNFKIGPLKVIEDGSLGSHSAAMRKPYINDKDVKGILNRNEEEFYTHCKIAYREGFPVITHCIGDASLELVCNVIDRLMKEYPSVDRRNGIVHCQIMDKELQERFKELNLLAYVQPVFIKADSKIVDNCIGSDLAKQSYNWRKFVDMGVHMSGGSDCPVEPFDILPNIYYAVTRKPSIDSDAWYPENSVNLEEAVNMFTKEGAYSSYDENRMGTISVGKLADLVVLDKNIFEEDIEEIFKTNVEMTMVGGRVVYERV